MSDGGLVTATVGAFTVESNSGVSQAQLERDLKPKADDAASRAGSELGKRGGKAAAEKRAAEKSDLQAEQSEPDEKPEVEAKAEPEAKEDKAEEPEKAEEKPPEKPKHLSKDEARQRVLEATSKAAEAKRELAAERQARAAVEARLEALERTGKPTPAEQPKRDPDAKPTPDAFGSYEEYLDARDAHNRKAWEAEIKQQERAAAIDHAVGEQVRKFQSITAPGLAQYSEEVLSLQTEFQIPEDARPSGANWLANELFFSPESAPTLMLHFTEHPDELQRIATLSSPRAVSREMAKLETRLEAATHGTNGTEREDVSRAAPPVRPVTGKPYVTESDEYRPGMSLDEYSKLWNKRRNR